LAASDEATPGDLWDRIRSGFSMPDQTDNRLVAKHIAWFSARPDYVERTLNRSRLYLYFIVSEVQRRGMPTEIALLPLVESAYNPHALSRSQASGMWQFIPSTARVFGLHQDWWYDGSKDIVATTYSALDYLQKLYDEFHEWDLALAGYNCGEGKIRREIAYNAARHLPTDYAHLNLADETRNYVPRLLAAKAIILAPEHYGLILPPIPDQPYFSAITTHKQLDTKVAAQLADMSEEDFLMLNPGFNRPLIRLNANSEKTILVPVTAAGQFVARLADPEVKLVSWQTRKLHQGEPLDRVAQQYGMSSEELKRVNGIAPSKRVAGGGVILVPTSTPSEDETAPPSSSPETVVEGTPESELPMSSGSHKKSAKRAMASNHSSTSSHRTHHSHKNHGSSTKHSAKTTPVHSTHHSSTAKTKKPTHSHKSPPSSSN
ncbi:MAG: transglycosylase SLT domain-containing protein, partial [Ferrovum sp.]|nr:transglycosylase SLT domain-containing protein [Ferrovum sp.]